MRSSSRAVEAGARFDVFFEEELERLFKALYFVTGNRHDAEELSQEAFLKLWERWSEIDRINDPTAYLFRVALNSFRARRRRASLAVRKMIPVAESPDAFEEAEMRADVRQLLIGLTPRQRAALLLVDLLGYSSEQAAHILRVRPSTVRSPVTGGTPTLVRSDAGSGEYSPDGRWLAYLSPGREPNGLWITSVQGGSPTGCPGVPRLAEMVPDATRISYSDNGSIDVLDVATGVATHVAEGGNAEWFDNDTLIVAHRN